MKDHIFEIWQGDLMVAKTSCSRRHDAYTEAMRYAMLYRQDGAVKIKEINPKGASGVEIEFSHRPTPLAWS